MRKWILATAAMALCAVAVIAQAPYGSKVSSLWLAPDTSTPTTFINIDNAAGSDALTANKTTGVFTFAAVPVFTSGIGPVSGTTATYTGQVNVSNGTAAEPAIGFTADDDATGTGIYRSAANTLAFSTNGVLAASIDANADLAVVRDVSALGLSTTTRAVSLGNGTGTFAVASTGLDISTGGAISNATTIGMGGALSGATTIAASGTISTTNGSVSIADLDGFNGDSGSQFSGITSVALDFVVGASGRTEAQTVRDDGETGTNWDEAVCAGGANTCMATPGVADAAVWKFGANSARLDLLDMAATDTIAQTAFGAEDWEALEDVGFWWRSNATSAATDFDLHLTDDGGTRSFDLPAITVANQWQFAKVDISALAAGTGDAITRISIECDHATNCDNRIIYIDNFYVWDSADETALTFNILDQPGAVGSAWAFVTLDSGAQTHARTALVHCATIGGSATDFVVDPIDNTIISVDDNSASTIELLYHRADY